MKPAWMLGTAAATLLAIFLPAGTLPAQAQTERASLPVGLQPSLLDARPSLLNATPLTSTAPARPVQPEADDCGCDPPPVLRTQAKPSAPATESVRAPATLTIAQNGAILRLEADTIEGLLDDGPLEARGRVNATYGPLLLQADFLRFDRQTGEGLASGSVVVVRPPYRIQADSLNFDTEAQTAEALNWQGWIEGEVQAHGRLLTMDASRSVAYDASLSPCLAEDPGYRFDFSHFELTPQPEGRSTIAGWNTVVRLSGVPVFWFPYFWASLPFPKLPELFDTPEIRSQLQAGYDAFDGFYVTSTGTYELAPGWTGRVPVRATTQRGVTVGIEQRLPLAIAEGRFDAFYTTPFPGDAGAFIPGPRANLSLFRDLPGGTGIMSLGYRVDVGNPFRIGPYPSLSNNPVSRLPEFAYYGMSQSAGPIRWSPSARLGYLFEEGGASSPLAELAVSGGGPEFWLPGRIHVASFGSLRGNAYRALTPAELTSGNGFLGRMARGVAQAGLSASTELLGFRLGGSAEVVRVLSATPTDFDGTPFGHDAIAPQDRLVGSVQRHVFGPFSVGADAVVARPHDASGALSWVQSDMSLNLSYQVNCVSVHFNYKPLIKGWGFSYVVTTF
jgi:hypothetical protein